MMQARPIFAALAVLALAGCAEPTPRPQPEPVGVGHLAPNIDWHTALTGDTVRVELVDPAASYRVERVTLRGPAGQEIPAAEVTNISRPGQADPSYGIGGGFGSHSGGGIGISMSVPLGGTAEERARSSLAVIPLPDPAAYRRTARDWTIEVALRDRGGTPYHASIPAPLP